MKPNGHSRPRLADVAKLAGVSLGSASRAMSHPDAVKPKTLAAVRAAAEALQYIPDESGRALASRRTLSIGVVLPTINNPIFAAFVHHLQKELAAKGYTLFVLAHEYDRAAETMYIERLVRRRADGIVLIGSDQEAEAQNILKRAGIPTVVTWSVQAQPRATDIGFSNLDAMTMIVEHLAKLGHRRIAMLSGAPDSNERAAARIASLREAATRHYMTVSSVHHVPLHIAGGQEGFARWQQASDGATALVCATDTIAAGVLHAAALAGVAVPAQLSVTGFDDIDISAILTPALTTVRTPVVEMARVAAASLLATLQGEPMPAHPSLPVELVVRASTGPAPV
ncbi:LacI family DNA-binding transcriptional regulator [Aquisediminimonas sediminicola]|uniref:LacI family DNA-binding transcriptional regulator n=1 Tax=Alteraquisediminimonas sediminicola TaxID=2676787 RepID=UPI001C8D8AB0|nr:substrate-binding domain-containing protein [Aquisediminimonas sediminicola]